MRVSWWGWFARGAAAAALALGAGEVTAALIGGRSIIAAVGSLVIALQPPGGKDLMVALFGEHDKLALEVLTGLGGVLLGGLLGLIGARDVRLPVAGYALAGVAAFLVAQRDPLAGAPESALTALAAVATGTAVFLLLSPRRPGSGNAAVAGPAAARAAAEIDRRALLGLTTVAVAAGGLLATVGRYLGSQPPPAAQPPPSTPVTIPVPAGSELALEGLTPIVVPNETFYRIDTYLGVPNIDPESWSLRIRGMVDREVTLRYSDLQAMEQVERFVTIACVSNEVGGRLVGNALWAGVPLVPLLARAGVQAGATQVVGRSIDGWTCGFPTVHLSGAGSGAMVALAMNREPLPAAHGFPARLIVPGLYGYVSATKWLSEIELTTLEDFDAYWVPLGWAKEAPILTQSRIDVPRARARVPAGAVQFAGVAWAPTRGITRVELSLDETETWHEAVLSRPLSDAAWVQWRVDVIVSPGDHTARVRATDGTGETQTAERTPPAPDGARGYHMISISAEA